MLPDISICEKQCKPPPVGEGETCGGHPPPGYVYPVCLPHLKCCPVPRIADLLVCMEKCPPRILGHGELCSNIAGPVRDGTCAKGLKCCNVKGAMDVGLCMTTVECKLGQLNQAK
ncbi:hypothetical protein HGRIS_014317 [Hohenbuehelia grisea]|uniref:WAP domain-containing protein n=1 Tax=Hohenbuehelia grisea TaxID=104357 RepID=A0ABR3JTN7_9AGAR